MNQHKQRINPDTGFILPTVEEARLLRGEAIRRLAGSSFHNIHEVYRVTDNLCRNIADGSESTTYQEIIVRTLNIMLHRQEIGRPVSFETAQRWAIRARRQAKRAYKGLQVA